jgi:hypothetical protein
MKRAPFGTEPAGFSGAVFELTGYDVCCTRAFFALPDLEFHLLTFVKGGVTLHPDFRVVNKQVITAGIWGYKSKAFFPVKPFYCTCTHFCTPLAI